MGKITDYSKATASQVTTNSVFLMDGSSTGTKGILSKDLLNGLMGVTPTTEIMSHININNLSEASSVNSSSTMLLSIGGTNFKIPISEVIYKIVDSIGSWSLRRQLYRGKSLGSSVTSSQFAAIKNGTFVDLFPGDYWSIGGRVWRIMDYNYWPDVTENHLVIMPDSNVIDNTKMNDIATNTGGYTNTKLRTETLPSVLTIIEGAFGSSHILSHRTLVITIPNGTSPQATYSYLNNTKVEIPDQVMLFGSVFVENGPNRTCRSALGQLAVCAISPKSAYKASCWLKECVWETSFASISATGQYIEKLEANSATRGIRPVFGLIG